MGGRLQNCKGIRHEAGVYVRYLNWVEAGSETSGEGLNGNSDGDKIGSIPLCARDFSVLTREQGYVHLTLRYADGADPGNRYKCKDFRRGYAVGPRKGIRVDLSVLLTIV
jgi:hypothetical protein